MIVSEIEQIRNLLEAVDSSKNSTKPIRVRDTLYSGQWVTYSNLKDALIGEKIYSKHMYKIIRDDIDSPYFDNKPFRIAGKRFTLIHLIKRKKK